MMSIDKNDKIEDDDLLLDQNISDDNLEIEIEGDLGNDAGVTETAPVAKKHEIKAEPESEVPSLKKQVEELRRQQAILEARAREAEAREKETRASAVGDKEAALLAEAEVLESKRKAARAQLIEAQQTGDFEKSADATELLGQLTSDLKDLSRRKAAMEEQITASKPTEGRVIKQEPADPVEALASNLPPKSAVWLRAHPECATNAKLNQKMIAAHGMAVAEDITVESPEYFAYIEKMLGFGHNDDAPRKQDEQEEQLQKEPRKAPIAAPVSRSVNTQSSNSRSITLTQAQRDAAEFSGLSLKEYAENLLALKNEGKIKH